MRRINSIEELRYEQRALRAKARDLEIVIRQDIEDIKHMFAPVHMLAGGAEKMLTSRNNGILGNTAGAVADFVTRNVLMRNAGFLSRLIVPYLVKNVTSNAVDKNKTDIVGWIGSMVSKFASRKKHKDEDNETGEE